MKKYKILIVLVVVLALAGISLAFANGNLQGMIFKNLSLQKKVNVQKISDVTKMRPNAAKNAVKDYCNQTKFKAVFVLLVKDPSEATIEVLKELNLRKGLTSTYFAKATNNLATMDTSDPIVVMNQEDSWGAVSAENSGLQIKVAQKFYETNDDYYDFLVVTKTFGVEEGYNALANNSIEGIGLPTGETPTIYGSWGSKGRLKSVIAIGNISDWVSTSFHTDPYQPVNVILHEIGHQWGVWVGDTFVGDGSEKLGIKDSYKGIHFFGGLQSPDKTGDPMYSHNWVANGDGTFRLENEFGYKKYHPFMLYFMGLLPKGEYATKYQIYNMGANGENAGNALPYKQVSVNDIIAVMGERKCK